MWHPICLEHKVRDTYLYNNPYLGGSMSQAQQVLSSEGAVAALEWLAHELEAGNAVSAAEFQTRCLAPVKFAMSRISAQEKKHGAWLEALPVWSTAGGLGD